MSRLAGLVGGLGPESTIDYYRRILDEWKQIDPVEAPSILIDSLDTGIALRLVGTDRPALIEYLSASLDRLVRAGVDFIAITANTPHIVFDELAARTPVPMVSIVEVCAAEARRQGLKRLLLLGTRFTMEGGFFDAAFKRNGMAIVVPDVDDRTWVHDRYVNQLLRGDFPEETRAEFIALIEKLRDEQHVDGVIFGGTELPLLLRAPEIAGLPTLDTTALHVSAIVEQLRD